MSDVWEMIADERRALADLLDRLTEAQWAAPSAIQGWSVRDVVAHLVWPLETSYPVLLWQVARTGSRELFTLCVVAAALGIAYGSAALFGVMLIASGAAYAIFPERRFVPLLVSLGVVVFGSGVLGTVTGFITTLESPQCTRSGE